MTAAPLDLRSPFLYDVDVDVFLSAKLKRIHCFAASPYSRECVNTWSMES